MSTANSILLLQGDAESRLLVDAEVALNAVYNGSEPQLHRAWTTRPDWFGLPAPASLQHNDSSQQDVRSLLVQPHRLVIFSLLPAIAMSGMRHRDGGVLLAHAGLKRQWSEDLAARIVKNCVEEPAMSVAAAIAALQPRIEALMEAGSAVAVCTAFRRVRAPLEFRGTEHISLRERIRQMNLEIARLSQRTGCFVLDLDRPLAQEGGLTLDADCFGGDGRAAEIALDEFTALVLDALPDSLGAS